MSFPRARLIRFNDVQVNAPAVGFYNPQLPMHIPTAKFGAPPKPQDGYASRGSSHHSNPDNTSKVPRTQAGHVPSHTEGIRLQLAQVVTQLEDRDRLIAQLRTSKEKLSVRVEQLELRLRDISKKLQGTRGAERQSSSRDKGVDHEHVLASNECPSEVIASEDRLTKDTLQLTAELQCLMANFTSESAACDNKIYLSDQDSNSVQKKAEAVVFQHQDILRELQLLQDKASSLRLEKENLIKGHQMFKNEFEKWMVEVRDSIYKEERQVPDVLNQENNCQQYPVEELKAELATAESNALCATEQKEELAVKLANIEMGKMHLMEEVSEARGSISSLSSKLESLTAAHVELQSEFARCVAAQHELQEKLQSATDTNATLHRDNEKLHANIESVISETQSLSLKLTQAGDYSRKIAADLEVEEMTRKELETVVENLKREATERNAEIAAVHSLRDELQKKLQNVSHQAESAMHDNMKLHVEIEALADDKQAISSILRTEETNRKELEKALSNLRKEGAETHTALEKANAALADSMVHNQELEKRLVESASHEMHLSAALLESTEALKVSEACRKDLQKELLCKEEEICEVIQQLSKVSAELEVADTNRKQLKEKLVVAEGNAAALHAENSRLLNDLQEEVSKRQKLEKHLEEAENHFSLENTRLETEIAKLLSEAGESNKKFLAATENISALRASYERACDDLKAAESRTKKYSTVCQELERKNHCLTEQLINIENLKEQSITDMQRVLDEATAEQKRCQQSYAELMARIAPFQEQLDMYEAEKKALEERNEATSSKLTEICRRYATLLGHQNHRQKIHFVDKLLQENLQMKQELLKLREMEHKQRLQINKLNIELVKASGHRRTIHFKENVQPEAP